MRRKWQERVFDSLTHALSGRNALADPGLARPFPTTAFWKSSVARQWAWFTKRSTRNGVGLSRKSSCPATSSSNPNFRRGWTKSSTKRSKETETYGTNMLRKSTRIYSGCSVIWSWPLAAADPLRHRWQNDRDG